MKKSWVYLGLCLAVGVFAWRMAWPHKQVPEKSDAAHEEHAEHPEAKVVKLSAKQIQDLGIQVQEANPKRLSITLTTRGKIILHPDHLAHIYPKVSGVVRDAYKNIGDEVKQGEILAVFESREMADIKANYLAAIEKEKLMQALLERERRLHEKKISAEQDYLNALSKYEEARIQVQLATQQLHAFGLSDQEIAEFSNQSDPDLRGFAIRAPIDGMIINRHITKGEYIDNASMIYEIADLSNLWVEIGVYPKDLTKVKEGQIVQVKLPGDEATTQAQIIFVSPIVQEETITTKAVAILCNTDRQWRPGTFVTINIDMENVDVPVAVPRGAVQEIDGESVVFVQVPEGFEKRAVRTGKEDIAAVEIIHGLNPGDKIASANTFLLKAELGKDDVEDDD